MKPAKAAVLHFTRCAAADWAPHGITVNAICPGLFMTDKNREWNETAAGRDRGVREERAGGPGRANPMKSARWRCIWPVPAATYVTGAAYVIDGGYTLW